MTYTFEQLQALVSTVMLLPAMVVLVVYAIWGRLTGPEDGWSPERFPEHDWWNEEAPR